MTHWLTRAHERQLAQVKLEPEILRQCPCLDSWISSYYGRIGTEAGHLLKHPGPAFISAHNGVGRV